MSKAKATKQTGKAKPGSAAAKSAKPPAANPKAAAAKPAKKPQPAAKKPQPAAKKKAPTRAKGKAVRASLSVEAKQRLLKPITGFADLLERLVATWKEHGRVVKVPGLTAAKLASLLRRAEAANKKEEAVRARLEARLRPLSDARLLAEHDAWKAALDLYAMTKAAARTDPGILVPFEFFAEALQRKRSAPDAGDASSEPLPE